MTLRVPDALHHFGNAKEFVTEAELGGEGRATSVRPTSGRVESCATALLRFEAPSPEPGAGLRRGEGTGVPPPCKEPVREDPRGHEGRGGLADP